MDIQALPHFLTRTKRPAKTQPERVQGIYLQEQSFRFAYGDTQKGSEGAQNELPAGTVLAECTCAACNRSAAATALFIP